MGFEIEQTSLKVLFYRYFFSKFINENLKPIKFQNGNVLKHKECFSRNPRLRFIYLCLRTSKKTNWRGTLQKQGRDPKNLTKRTMKLVKQNKSYEKRRDHLVLLPGEKFRKATFFLTFPDNI